MIFLKRYWMWVSGTVVLIGGLWLWFGGSSSPAYDTATVQRGDVTQEVSVTGRIKAAQSVDLAMEKGGRVARVYADVGARVVAGQLLVQLENADLVAQLQQAEANFKAQQAKLDELKTGTRPEEIQIQEIKVQNAQVALEDARRNLVDKINDAYTKSDDAIRNKVDQIFNNPLSSSPQVSFIGGSAALETQVEADRPTLEAMLLQWHTALLGLDTTNHEAMSDLASKNLEHVKAFLEEVALLVNSLTANTSISQTTIDSYKADVSTARTNVNTAIGALSTAQEKYRTAVSTLVLADNQLTLEKAGTVVQQITAQEAQVEEAEANIKNYQAQVYKTIIRSPIAGIVTKQDAKVGEIVAANAAVTAVISDQQYEIEANVPEVDIPKIKIGNSAKVTLDAYGSNAVFNATVVKIDPAETIIEDVATYKITLQFTQADERIKSGMTANIDVVTAQREGVLTIPQRAVSGRNSTRTVQVLDSSSAQPREVQVTVGVIGSDGRIEILSGIQEGDVVVVGEKS